MHVVKDRDDHLGRLWEEGDKAGVQRQFSCYWTSVWLLVTSLTFSQWKVEPNPILPSLSLGYSYGLASTCLECGTRDIVGLLVLGGKRYIASIWVCLTHGMLTLGTWPPCCKEVRSSSRGDHTERPPWEGTDAPSTIRRERNDQAFRWFHLPNVRLSPWCPVQIPDSQSAWTE